MSSKPRLPPCGRRSKVRLILYCQIRAKIPLDVIFLVEYTRAHPETVNPDNALGFISDNGGDNYNLCHCK